MEGAGKEGGGGGEEWAGWLEAAWVGWVGGLKTAALQSTPAHTPPSSEDTYFFCSLRFFSAGPPREPTPRPSLGELSDSGVPAADVTTSIQSTFTTNEVPS